MAIIDTVHFQGNDSEFVWKYPSENLRLGTQLVVKPAQVAFFVYRGRICDEVKHGTITLNSGNIPLLTSLTSLPFGGDSPFQAEVWFVNLISKLDNKWGTLRPIQLEDPKYGLVVSVRAFGQFGFRIGEPRRFLEAISGTAKVFMAGQIVEYFKGAVLQAVNISLGRAFVTERISILEASVHLDALAKHCSDAIGTELRTFGVELVNFFFHSINVPDEDGSYQRLKVIKEKAAELNLLGRDIYQYDRSMEVLKAAAVNEGGGTGLMQAGLGLAVGAGIGQQMAQQAGQLVTKLSERSTPPPLPKAIMSYHVSIDNKDSGELDLDTIKRMVSEDKIHGNTLVWREGLEHWVAASTQPELQPLFQSKPPPLPPDPPTPIHLA